MVVHKKDLVQLWNPLRKHWVLVNAKIGKIVGHRKTPYKDVRIRE